MEVGPLKKRLQEEVGTVQDFKIGTGGFHMQNMKWAMVTFVEDGTVMKAVEKIPQWTWQHRDGPMAGVLRHCSCRPLQDRRPKKF
jgi:hypothetical protein